MEAQTQQESALKLAGEAVAEALAHRDQAHHVAMIVTIAAPSAELVAKAREVLAQAIANLTSAATVFAAVQELTKRAWEKRSCEDCGDRLLACMVCEKIPTCGFCAGGHKVGDGNGDLEGCVCGFCARKGGY